ncbi:MAG: sigma 54-interacting transcriptional regulator, partial [Candidatus Aminicenantales bacterium]
KSESELNALIGHFGLGFYSSFMVSDKVEIFSKTYKKGGETKAVHWECDGSPDYTMDECDKKDRGTEVVLTISDESKEYLEEYKVLELLKKYCKFLPVPIQFGTEKHREKVEGEKDAEGKEISSNFYWLGQPDAPDDWAEIFAQFAADRPAMSEIIDLVARVAPTDAAVLIEGEIGTGKALLAYHLHSRSRRSGGPFVRVPCDSLGETDADETLFGRPGHNGDGKEPVAPGFLRSALGGTLFLENVCHLPFATQVKLFDALQGDDRDRPALPEARRGDVRVVASTREDLKAAVAENRFYSGLYYLLNVVPVRVPALRQRPQDVRLLAERFLAAVSRTWNPDRPPPRFNDQAWECLLGYDWPGNAAQLAGAVARAAVLSNGPEIGPECLPDLPPPGSPARRNGDTVSLPLAGGLKAMERSIIEEMVHRCRGNKAAAARALGLHRRTLYRMLDEGVSPLDGAPQAGAPAPTHLPAIVPAA